VEPLQARANVTDECEFDEVCSGPSRSGLELRDLVIVDEQGAAGPADCGLDQAARLVSVSAHPQPDQPIVLLTHEADADYRIYVDSQRISPEQAAALIVAVRGGQKRLAGESVDSEPTGSLSLTLRQP